MSLNTIRSPSLDFDDIKSLAARFFNKVLTKGIYKPDKAYSTLDVTLELQMALKTLLEEIRSGHCEEEIDNYIFLKNLKDKNPSQYEKVLKWNNLQGVPS